MDISFLGGPLHQRGIGVVAPFDFALDRELWRWVPDDVSLHLTRTPFVPVEVSLGMARLISEHETLREGVRALYAVAPEVVAYACTSGSFVGGVAGERHMCRAMAEAGSIPSVTTSGALLEALGAVGATRIALVTPYTKSVTDALETYLAEAGVTVTGREYLGLTREIWRVPYRDVVDMARSAVVGTADALFISCTNLPTYDVIPQLEAELRMPVLSANQVTMWAALRHLGKPAVGPYQALIDPAARMLPGQAGPALPGALLPGAVLPGSVVMPEPTDFQDPSGYQEPAAAFQDAGALQDAGAFPDAGGFPEPVVLAEPAALAEPVGLTEAVASPSPEPADPQTVNNPPKDPYTPDW